MKPICSTSGICLSTRGRSTRNHSTWANWSTRAERRRIVGDFTLTALDQVAGRTYPDTIAKSQTGYDTHGYIVEPYFLLRHPHGQTFTSYVPYRCLLPRGLEGLLVTGIGLSAHRDAQPIVRMQPDIQNQDYAAGAAAALAAREGTRLRHIDVRALQRHLVDIGNLPESVLTDEDSHPLPAERVAAAVPTILDDYRSLAIILGHRDVSLTATRELLIARALYRCGDWEGLGEHTLRQYTQDLRGHFVRHAQAVLAAGQQYRPGG